MFIIGGNIWEECCGFRVYHLVPFSRIVEHQTTGDYVKPVLRNTRESLDNRIAKDEINKRFTSLCMFHRIDCPNNRFPVRNRGRLSRELLNRKGQAPNIDAKPLTTPTLPKSQQSRDTNNPHVVNSKYISLCLFYGIYCQKIFTP